jgi:hypothetical protein
MNLPFKPQQGAGLRKLTRLPQQGEAGHGRLTPTTARILGSLGGCVNLRHAGILTEAFQEFLLASHYINEQGKGFLAGGMLQGNSTFCKKTTRFSGVFLQSCVLVARAMQPMTGLFPSAQWCVCIGCARNATHDRLVPPRLAPALPGATFRLRCYRPMEPGLAFHAGQLAPCPLRITYQMTFQESYRIRATGPGSATV